MENEVNFEFALSTVVWYISLLALNIFRSCQKKKKIMLSVATSFFNYEKIFLEILKKTSFLNQQKIHAEYIAFH